LGKALWDKGHGHMMDLLQAHEAKHGQVGWQAVAGSVQDAAECAHRAASAMQQ
jgi:hypothetical protein